MKNFFTLTLCVFTLFLTAQEPLTYPYNPDANSDQFVAVSDVLETIATYGDQFLPSEIMVGDTTLSNWIQILNQTLSYQQAVIDSLQANLDSQDTQLDSTMIADMISAAGGLGCNDLLSNPKYPQGLVGETISVMMTSENNYSYTVPEGNNLYVYATNHGPGGGPVQSVYINDLNYGPVGAFCADYTLFSSGEVISIGDEFNDLDFIGFIGFLIDEGPIASIDVSFDQNNTNWTVPSGKYFMPQRFYTVINGADQILLDGENFCQDNDPGCKWLMSTGNRAFIGSGSVYSLIFNEHPEGVFNMRGYLVDEDYFADCGGGGSSEGDDVSSYSPDIHLECVDMGVSVMCPGLGLDPSFPLESPNNFNYNMSGDIYLNSENYIQQPHWRKFQVVGLNNFMSGGQLMFKHRTQTSDASNNTSDTYPNFHFLTPEINNGSIYFYMYEVYQYMDCANADDILLSIPEEHSWNVSYSNGGYGHNYKSSFELFYETPNGYRPTGIIFDR